MGGNTKLVMEFRPGFHGSFLDSSDKNFALRKKCIVLKFNVDFKFLVIARKKLHMKKKRL